MEIFNELEILHPLPMSSISCLISFLSFKSIFREMGWDRKMNVLLVQNFGIKQFNPVHMYI